MAEERVQRRLAAILAADVAGYSALMGADEEGTLATLTAHLNELIEPCIDEHRGRVVKTTGDGLLAEFASVVDAVRCAVAFQDGMRQRNAGAPDDRRMEFRIGVNLGDIIVQDGDVYGDGVNVAARLEGLAEPGGTCISASVFDHVEGKLDVSAEDLGEKELKGVARPVRVYAVRDGAARNVAGAAPLAEMGPPSIAVLPFANMSSDHEQEYLSDGISEDLITALSRIKQFRVIARNSSFAYKGASPDVRDVARQLGVRYVIEGSMRRSGDRIRLTAQLVDGASGNHVWAQRYDREIADIFAVQDELTETIVGAIEPELLKAEQVGVRARPPESLGAWECYHQAMWHLDRHDQDNNREARRLFARVVALDPNFGPAHAGLALTYLFAVLIGDDQRDREEALNAAQTARQLDGSDALAHYALGGIHVSDRKPVEAIADLERSLSLNPSYADAHHLLARAFCHTGEPGKALLHARAAVQLSPNDPLLGPYHGAQAMAHLYLGEHEKAVTQGRLAVSLAGLIGWGNMLLISALGHLGRTAEAAEAIDVLAKARPHMTLAFARDNFPTVDADCHSHFLDGLSKAGLAE